jgi:hypothetical protein
MACGLVLEITVAANRDVNFILFPHSFVKEAAKVRGLFDFLFDALTSRNSNQPVL